MKKTIVLTLCLLSFVWTKAQQSNKVPSVSVKSINGQKFDTGTIANSGKPVIISFWATWCKPCMNELNAISEEYGEWQDETGVKLIAISIDDSRNVPKVGPLVNSKGWEFDVYTDENGDFKRAMNVNNVPHTFLVDGNGQIVWQHNAYAPGDEKSLYEKVKKLAKGDEVSH